MAFNAINYIEDVPKEYEEIKGHKNEQSWLLAVNRELEAIHKNET